MEVDPALSAPGQYDTILTQEQLDSWIARLRAAGQFAFDTETDSLDPLQADLIGLSVAAEPGQAAYLPFGHNFPAPRPSSTVPRRWRSWRRCSPTLRCASSASTASTTCT